MDVLGRTKLGDFGDALQILYTAGTAAEEAMVVLYREERDLKSGDRSVPVKRERCHSRMNKVSYH